MLPRIPAGRLASEYAVPASCPLDVNVEAIGRLKRMKHAPAAVGSIATCPETVTKPPTRAHWHSYAVDAATLVIFVSVGV